MPARITKQSPLSDKWHTLLIEQYEQDEFERRYLAWNHGKMYIQDAFPDLTNGQREFIKTGITSEEWKKYIGDDDA
jgi:hypothetical protein